MTGSLFIFIFSSPEVSLYKYEFRIEEQRAAEKKRGKGLGNLDDVCDDHEEETGQVEEEMEKTFDVLKGDPLKPEEPKNKKPAVVDKSLDSYLSKDYSFLDKLVNTYKTSHIEGKRLYYLTKMKFNADVFSDLQKINHILEKYTEGLQFVLYYYYTGCPDWDWYYPDYYAPLISDLADYLKHVSLFQS